MGLNIRSNTWIQGQLSWSVVVVKLFEAFEELGHNMYPLSTNGIKDSEPYMTEERVIQSIVGLDKLKRKKIPVDLDFCYTVPPNFPQRFLPNSKHKAAIYNYETDRWPKEWSKYYHLVDFYFPSSNFSAEIFYRNGVPKEKIFVIPHGVDTNIFNPNIPPVKLKTKKKFKFVSVCAPHYRKNLELLLESYCEAFTNNDDVCLVLKTKNYKHSDGIFSDKNPKGRKGFEIVLGDVFRKLAKRFGKSMPEIELLSGHVESVASIYNSADCLVTTTGAEGWYMPGLESFNCNDLINIAPRYSGHLHYMNDDNTLLIDTKLRRAKPLEQYWGYNEEAVIGQASKEHTIELMRKVVVEKDQLLEKFKPGMKAAVKEFSWKNAAQLMIDVTEGNMKHYIPGTYNTWPR